jgi:DNA-binding transcriptional ArsR family regulator
MKGDQRSTRVRDNQRVIENIDATTGEVLEGTMVFVPAKKKSAFGRDWFAMAQGAMDFLAHNRSQLGEEGFAVFCKVVAKLDFENFIQISQAALAREIGMKPANFSRAMKRLVDLGIIMKGPKVGTSQTYRLNPSVGWKGSGKTHFTALQEAKKKGWKVIESEPELPFE